MKSICNLLLLLILCVAGYAQQPSYSKFYYQRASLFEELPIQSQDVVFLGNSITNGSEWHELFNAPNFKNRGISGDLAQGVYDRLQPIIKGKPQKVFLLIGINDLQRGTPPDSVIYWVQKIIQQLKQQSPDTKLYIQSILPVNTNFRSFSDQITRLQAIEKTNQQL